MLNLCYSGFKSSGEKRVLLFQYFSQSTVLCIPDSGSVSRKPDLKLQEKTMYLEMSSSFARSEIIEDSGSYLVDVCTGQCIGDFRNNCLRPFQSKENLYSAFSLSLSMQTQIKFICFRETFIMSSHPSLQVTQASTWVTLVSSIGRRVDFRNYNCFQFILKGLRRYFGLVLNIQLMLCQLK